MRPPAPVRAGEHTAMFDPPRSVEDAPIERGQDKV
jgi:hypothetical protein